MARRVISRMTDSVNCSALAESRRRASSPAGMGAVLDLDGFILFDRPLELKSRPEGATPSSLTCGPKCCNVHVREVATAPATVRGRYISGERTCRPPQKKRTRRRDTC